MIIDVNCAIGAWPFRECGARSVDELEAILEAEDVDLALTSSLEAVLASDPDGPNRRLIADSEGRSRIDPVPVINPRLYGWRKAFDSYRPAHAVKVHPNYHGYALSGIRSEGHAEALAAALIDAGMPLLLSIRLFDDRFHPPAMRVPPVPITEIREFAETHRDLSIICLNPYLSDVRALADLENISCDIASVETYRTVETMLKSIEPARVVFGSNTPFYVPRAALMKLVWTDAKEDAVESIAHGNIEALLG